MYCDNCGQKINDSAKFCHNCGKNINSALEKKKESKLSRFLIALFVIIVTFTVIGIIVNNTYGNKNNDNNLLTRDATNNDVNIYSEMNLENLSIDLKITPYENIDNLTLKISYYESDNNLLKTSTKNVGNVKKGIEVTKQISLTEFSMSEIMKIYRFKIEVIDGNISYIE